jgi:CheY-like chemotaxis protein
MEGPNNNSNHSARPLKAVAILPNRSLAQQFLRALPERRAFQIDAEWTTYPALAKLESQLRQTGPDVVLVDVSADLSRATTLIEAVAGGARPVPVIALHISNDAGPLLECLRAGAVEFLYAPFTGELQRQAVARIARLLPGRQSLETRRGRLVAFSSAKPGSGASTLAAHTAFALHEVTGQRILLVDFALFSGTMRLLFKLAGRCIRSIASTWWRTRPLRPRLLARTKTVSTSTQHWLPRPTEQHREEYEIHRPKLSCCAICFCTCLLGARVGGWGHGRWRFFQRPDGFECHRERRRGFR